MAHTPPPFEENVCSHFRHIRGVRYDAASSAGSSGDSWWRAVVARTHLGTAAADLRVHARDTSAIRSNDARLPARLVATLQLPAASCPCPALTIKPPGRQHTAKKSTRTRRGILWCRSVRQCRPPVASVALGAACVGRPRVPHFLFDARVDAGIDSRIAPVIVILAKACLGKICCKTGAKRRQRAHPRTQRGDPAARRPSARRALAPRERGGSGRNRRGV